MYFVASDDQLVINSDNHPFIWISCVGAETHPKHAGHGVPSKVSDEVQDVRAQAQPSTPGAGYTTLLAMLKKTHFGPHHHDHERVIIIIFITVIGFDNKQWILPRPFELYCACASVFVPRTWQLRLQGVEGEAECCTLHHSCACQCNAK